MALALGSVLWLAAAGVARAQNIPEPDPKLSQTWTGEVVYKTTEGTNWGVVAVYNKDEKYAKGFKVKIEDFKKLDVKEGDNVEVTWIGPRNDRTERKEVKINKTSGTSN
jgi:Rieske Fe-S protein